MFVWSKNHENVQWAEKATFLRKLNMKIENHYETFEYLFTFLAYVLFTFSMLKK